MVDNGNIQVDPKFITNLIGRIEGAIWKEFDSYKKAETYVARFRKVYNDFGDADFYISYKDKESTQIDLYSTLANIEDDETLFKIAVSLGIEIPDLIFAIPEIKGILASDYEAAHITFENALKKVASEPSVSICCANSALESIIKHICKDRSIAECKQGDTLYKLTSHLLKEFKYYPDKKLNENIRNIGSSLLKISQNIEAMRSNHSDTSHGKTSEDYIVDDELYAKFVINAVSTVGLFLLNFYKKKYRSTANTVPSSYADYRSNGEDIPF